MKLHCVWDIVLNGDPGSSEHLVTMSTCVILFGSLKLLDRSCGCRGLESISNLICWCRAYFWTVDDCMKDLELLTFTQLAGVYDKETCMDLFGIGTHFPVASRLWASSRRRLAFCRPGDPQWDD